MTQLCQCPCPTSSVSFNWNIKALHKSLDIRGTDKENSQLFLILGTDTKNFLPVTTSAPSFMRWKLSNRERSSGLNPNPLELEAHRWLLCLWHFLHLHLQSWCTDPKLQDRQPRKSTRRSSKCPWSYINWIRWYSR